MKKKFMQLTTILAMVVLAGSAAAQKNNASKSADWVSEKGYWVIQSNKNTPLEHVVLFYDKENNHVSTQVFKGEKLDPAKRKTKVKLRKALEDVLSATQISMGEGDQPLYFATY